MFVSFCVVKSAEKKGKICRLIKNGYNLALVVTAVKGIVEAFDTTKQSPFSTSSAPPARTEGKPKPSQTQPVEVSKVRIKNSVTKNYFTSLGFFGVYFRVPSCTK